MIPDFLISFDTRSIHVKEVDFLVVGVGIAGMRAAIELKDFKTIIIAKDGIKENSTYKAQGGIASVVSETDSLEKHIEDTLQVGCGVSDIENVKLLVEEGPERIKELVAWGIEFDKFSDGLYQLTREGGHSLNRILHIQGDFTGKGLFDFLYQKVLNEKKIELMNETFLIDIVSVENNVVGALVYSETDKKLTVISAKGVILASGGAGNVYQETSNPASITGDGIAAAYRRGADIVDCEFYQFHPTTLYLAGAPRFLISESMRGEGAMLLDKDGETFMSGYHPAKELAGRDIVSRAIIEQMRRSGSNCVYLDITHMDADYIMTRFPQIYKFCKSYGIDITREPIPVRPSAHYFIGGIKTDQWSRTSLNNLYACGENACTGVHGANRLASNSLLEGLVFGKRAGAKAVEECANKKTVSYNIRYSFPQKSDILIDSEDLRRSVRSLMFRNVGIERDREGLMYAEGKFKEWTRYAFWKEFSDRYSFETLNLLTIAMLMTNAALQRTESRGTHYRKDYPARDDENWKKHIVFNIKDLQE